MNDPPFPFVPSFFLLVPELHFPKWCRKMDKVFFHKDKQKKELLLAKLNRLTIKALMCKLNFLEYRVFQ